MNNKNSSRSKKIRLYFGQWGVESPLEMEATELGIFFWVFSKESVCQRIQSKAGVANKRWNFFLFRASIEEWAFALCILYRKICVLFVEIFKRQLFSEHKKARIIYWLGGRRDIDFSRRK